MPDPTPRTLAERLEAIARHRSPSHLQHRFKVRFGLSPQQYQDGYRMQRRRGALQAGGAGQVIHYATRWITEGLRLLAATAQVLGRK